jgi:hypothetical protein
MASNPRAFARPFSLDTYWDNPKNCDDQQGMSLRDYFAAAAISGLLSDPAIFDFEEAAGAAYRAADAMLEVREGGTGDREPS